MKSRLFIGFFVVFVLLSSCNRGEVYYKFHPIKNGSWNKQTGYNFLLDSLTVLPEEKYDLFLEIVNGKQYPYRNLWLIVLQNVSDTAFVTDTVEIKLADAHGKWLGNGSAGLYQLSVPYKASIALDTARRYFVRIRHGMKDDPVKGIEKVGVRMVATRQR